LNSTNHPNSELISKFDVKSLKLYIIFFGFSLVYYFSDWRGGAKNTRITSETTILLWLCYEDAGALMVSRLKLKWDLDLVWCSSFIVLLLLLLLHIRLILLLFFCSTHQVFIGVIFRWIHNISQILWVICPNFYSYLVTDHITILYWHISAIITSELWSRFCNNPFFRGQKRHYKFFFSFTSELRLKDFKWAGIQIYKKKVTYTLAK
jgi:hypothetical protein